MLTFKEYVNQRNSLLTEANKIQQFTGMIQNIATKAGGKAGNLLLKGVSSILQKADIIGGGIGAGVSLASSMSYGMAAWNAGLGAVISSILSLHAQEGLQYILKGLDEYLRQSKEPEVLKLANTIRSVLSEEPSMPLARRIGYKNRNDLAIVNRRHFAKRLTNALEEFVPESNQLIQAAKEDKNLTDDSLIYAMLDFLDERGYDNKTLEQWRDSHEFLKKLR